MNSTSSPTRQYYYWLDSIRFLAAFIVVISHTAHVFQTNFEGLADNYNGPLSAIMYLILRSGAEAVLIFFVLSGFLVGGRSAEKIRNGHFNTRSYIIDRSVRILLPLIPALLLSYIVNYLIGENYTWYDYLGNLLSLQGIFVPPVNGVLWSLSCEVWYYVFMLGVALLIVNKSKKWGGVFILVLSLMAISNLHITGWYMWMFGALFFIIRKNIISSKATWAMIALFVIMSFYMKQTYRGLLIPSIPTPSRDVILSLYGLSAAYLLSYVIDKKPHSKPGIVLQSLGEKWSKFSYTLYLCHYPLLHVVYKYIYPVQSDQMNLCTTLTILLIATCVTLICYPIYYLFERHTSTVKQFINSHLIHKP